MFHAAINNDGTTAEKDGAGPCDPVEDVGQVLLGLLTGPDTGDEPTLLPDDVRLLVGIKGHVHVEEGEQQDENEIAHDIEEAGRSDVVVHPGTEPGGGDDVRQPVSYTHL